MCVNVWKDMLSERIGTLETGAPIFCGYSVIKYSIINHSIFYDSNKRGGKDSQ